MTVQRALRWFFRVESWLAFAGGALLLGFGGYLAVEVRTGAIELSEGSDLPRAALTAIGLGVVALGLGYLLHRAARSLHAEGALVRPPAVLAVSVACHIGLLAGIAAALVL